MTAKIHNDHAFILWSQQMELLHVYMLAINMIKQKKFLNVCIFVLLGLHGAWENLLLALKGLEKALNFVTPKGYEPCAKIWHDAP